MNVQGKWINAPLEHADAVPEFLKGFRTERKIARATLEVTALGVY